MTVICIALTMQFHYEPKMIKINLHKIDISPFRRYPRKIAFFTNKLYISDVYHIFLNRRDVNAYEYQCFV